MLKMYDLPRLLLPAAGFLELGLAADAVEELDALPRAVQNRREVLALRVSAHCAAEEWGKMRRIAATLVDRWPEEASHWISHAFATRRCHDIAEAEAILLEAAVRHPSEAMIHYNLACYAAQTDRPAEALERLRRAMKIEPKVKDLALADPDLLPLWRVAGVGEWWK